MKESSIETCLRKAVERAGGRCLKWVSPGHTGVPDRIILMPGGRVYFAETKAPGEKERARQEYVQRKLRELGFEVFSSVDTFERVEEVMKELTEERKLTNAGKIRAMDDEELAYFLKTTSCSICCDHPLNCGFDCASLYTIKAEKAEKTEQVSLLDRLAAEYDRKHPNGLKFVYSPDGEEEPE